MKFLVLTILVLTVSFSFGSIVDSSAPIITREYVEQAKKELPFETYDYEDNPFKDYSLDQLKRVFGVELPSDKEPSLLAMPVAWGNFKSLPANYNTKAQYPNCNLPIRHQGNCGSCWAFAATGVLADRFCIQSGGKYKMHLSPQFMVSCDKGDGACKGGLPQNSWQFLQYTGVVTENCFPYQSANGYIPQCPYWQVQCSDGTNFYKFKAKSSYRYQSIEQALNNIMTNGPIETGFQVYQDFTQYKGGIYVQRSSVRVGGHAVKIVGWGNQSGINYWVVENSYGPTWGENGYFRIKMGECEFERELIGGDPLF